MDRYNSYAVVDLNILKENFKNICAYTKTPVMAVIKADAYGHGAVKFAKTLQEEAAFFGVAALSEALELRENGHIVLESPLHGDQSVHSEGQRITEDLLVVVPKPTKASKNTTFASILS